MGFTHSIWQNFEVAVAGTPGTWTGTPQFGEWVRFAGIGRQAMLIPVCGELDANMLVEVYEATDGVGTGAQVITGLNGIFTNGSDEGTYGLITVRTEDLDAGYDYIAAYVTPGSTDAFAGVWVIGELYAYPAENDLATFEDHS